jgi:hypothetical protein
MNCQAGVSALPGARKQEAAYPSLRWLSPSGMFSGASMRATPARSDGARYSAKVDPKRSESREEEGWNPGRAGLPFLLFIQDSSLLLVLDLRAMRVQRVNARPRLPASSTVELNNNAAFGPRSASRGSSSSAGRFALSCTTTARSALTRLG